jgi:hypothetical protein
MPIPIPCNSLQFLVLSRHALALSRPPTSSAFIPRRPPCQAPRPDLSIRHLHHTCRLPCQFPIRHLPLPHATTMAPQPTVPQASRHPSIHCAPSPDLSIPRPPTLVRLSIPHPLNLSLLSISRQPQDPDLFDGFNPSDFRYFNICTSSAAPPFTSKIPSRSLYGHLRPLAEPRTLAQDIDFSVLRQPMWLYLHAPLSTRSTHGVPT